MRKKKDSDVCSDVCFIRDISWLMAVENLNQGENNWKAVFIKLIKLFALLSIDGINSPHT